MSTRLSRRLRTVYDATNDRFLSDLPMPDGAADRLSWRLHFESNGDMLVRSSFSITID